MGSRREGRRNISPISLPFFRSGAPESGECQRTQKERGEKEDYYYNHWLAGGVRRHITQTPSPSLSLCALVQWNLDFALLLVSHKKVVNLRFFLKIDTH